MSSNLRWRITVVGIVQGVGFRPFVPRLATDLHLAGFVRNTTSAVVIEVEGPANALSVFRRRLESEAPSGATLEAFFRNLKHLCTLYQHDAHPGYLSTQWAIQCATENGLSRIAVQHHRAHVASVMAEYGLGPKERVVAAIIDGTGYGDDGAILGGEFFTGSVGSLKLWCGLVVPDRALARDARSPRLANRGTSPCYCGAA